MRSSFSSVPPGRGDPRVFRSAIDTVRFEFGASKRIGIISALDSLGGAASRGDYPEAEPVPAESLVPGPMVEREPVRAASQSVSQSLAGCRCKMSWSRRGFLPSRSCPASRSRCLRFSPRDVPRVPFARRRIPFARRYTEEELSVSERVPRGRESGAFAAPCGFSLRRGSGIRVRWVASSSRSAVRQCEKLSRARARAWVGANGAFCAVLCVLRMRVPIPRVFTFRRPPVARLTRAPVPPVSRWINRITRASSGGCPTREDKSSTVKTQPRHRERKR